MLEPWGEERGDLRAGIVASTIANVNRGKGQQPFKPEQFMPYAKREQSGKKPKPLTVMRAWFGDRVKRSDNPSSGNDR